jgi:hypothetical protein
MSMFPSSLVLEERQKEAVLKWMHDLNVKHPLVEEDEDCCMSSPLIFQICGSGIGDSVRVKYRARGLDISIDDNNELILTEF